MELSTCGIRLGAAAFAAGLSLVVMPGLGSALADTAAEPAASAGGDATPAAASRPARGPARAAASTVVRENAPRRQQGAPTANRQSAPAAATIASAATASLSAAPGGSADRPLAVVPIAPAGELLQGTLLLARRSAPAAAATVPSAAATASIAPPFTVDTTTTFTTIYGTTAAGTITVNGHTWVADPTTYLYTTTADLAQQWQSYYTQMKAGQGATLTDVQRLAGNAEAVFQNTRLKNLNSAQLLINRQDVQRCLDAMYAAMVLAGVDVNSTLTQQQYLAVESALQGNPTLLELAVQGHGLNNSGIARYAGYTNHFQTGVDGQTRYIGGGLNNNTNALARFFDDNILTHMPYPTVVKGGVLWQLNQNGNRENTVADSVAALNAGLTRTYLSSDFLQPPQLVTKTPRQVVSAGTPFSFTVPADTFVDPQGQPITYSATLPLGAALPSWLSFNATTRQFSGTAPAGKQVVGVVVRATNSSGLFTNVGFAIAVK